jgi:hypothetical protein
VWIGDWCPLVVNFPSVRDRLTKERRSWNMSRIRGKNTSPELIAWADLTTNRH